jgi:hypothetical protein
MLVLQQGSRGPDVKRLQQALNQALRPSPRLSEDLYFGPATHQAVVQFQKLSKLVSDGRVGPKTWTALERAKPAGGGPVVPLTGAPTLVGGVFDFRGKPFMQRLDAWLAYVNKEYALAVGKVATNRDPADAQRWHIAHMFRYNAFATRRPSVTEAGKKTIKWDHFKDPANWDSRADWREFLRDKLNRVPVRWADGKGWVAGTEPDRDMTTRRAYEILRKAGIATSEASSPHGAMVAPGYAGCVNPCRCGGSPSKHLAGLACDITKPPLPHLDAKLKAVNAGTIDDNLKQFGLKRPMPKEPWHIEATDT